MQIELDEDEDSHAKLLKLAKALQVSPTTLASEILEDGISARYREHASPLSVACSFCGAKQGDPCVRGNGSSRRGQAVNLDPHAARVVASRLA